MFFSVSVSYCTSGILVWSNEVVQGLQEEDEYRKPGMYMWSFNWMDCVAHCVLCTLWNLRWDRWRATWFWRWIHFGPSSHWDWCHPSGTVHIDIPLSHADLDFVQSQSHTVTHLATSVTIESRMDVKLGILSGPFDLNQLPLMWLTAWLH